MNEERLIADLLARYREDGVARGPLDFVYRYGSVLDALLYSCLLWPRFVEIDSMVFVVGRLRGRNVPDLTRLHDALARFQEASRVEESFNLFEIPSDLFENVQDTTDEQVYWLAERLAEMWRAKLTLDFPGRRFTVKVLSPEETGGEIGITFYQDHN